MTGRANRADLPPALILSDYLPYRLSVVSNKASGLIARAYQARFGLSIWEWRVIAVLGGGEAITAQAICEATAMDKVTVSRALRALAERSLVQRRPSPTDKRAALVSLTGDGRAIYEEIAPLALEWERSLLEGFSREEAEQLSRLLERLEAQADVLGRGEPL
ncbi:MAG: winged helix-turn-helix transcriptional regulator [Oceanicaulis sp.]|uniref:MarR family winged helix-turn-helix transcriptional regulator n=1 Tax=Glycocaulis sp. TaxID=1969725 RepID=UPI0025BE6980|nr:MarR family winged helix-turn-helix transcriptional regulator [Glycocaulis sp.]MCC5981082.1 winged helix-turn-helix transcriptional regulator [Oceanicaulis sp.]MCH8522070.1 MarR family winged helix-turn-helix transcriptional regulator [Glycocaulis sp.]